MWLCAVISPSRVKELGPGGNGRPAPRPAKPSQRQSPADEDSLYQEEEEEEEEEVEVGAVLSPANSDLRILHRSLRRVCVCACVVYLALYDMVYACLEGFCRMAVCRSGGAATIE